MKRNFKLNLALVALLALIALFSGLYLSSRPQPGSGLKSITVTVVHSDKSEKTFAFQTEKDYLGDLLLSEGLAAGEQGQFGLYIKEVDREVADYSINGAYWALFEGDSYATQGADTTPLTDGDQFRLVYTIG